MLKHYLLLLTLFTLLFSSFAQTGKGYNKNYTPLRSDNPTADKNFYLLTALRQSPDILQQLSASKELTHILHAKTDLIRLQANTHNPNTDSLLNGLLWNAADSLRINQELRLLYQSHKVLFDRLADAHLRPSGYYQRFVMLNNEELLMHAWDQYFYGINYIIHQFGTGKKMRYPSIDSASYYTRGNYFRSILLPLSDVLAEQSTDMKCFYEPSLQLALWLMEINDRKEPAQFEPLGQGENKAAARKVAQTQWSNYRYTALLIPGEGPELANQPLSPGGKMRCALAAARFKQKLAPFIIVSGGNCHPFHTPYNEAWEMKQYLMKHYHIPESAIIMEPQARHTTTNFRNGSRLLIRYGFPADKPVLCVTTSDQAAYIADKRFDTRNLRELGYLPYRNKQSINVHESSFYLVLDCLHMDPADPLDP